MAALKRTQAGVCQIFSMDSGDIDVVKQEMELLIPEDDYQNEKILNQVEAQESSRTVKMDEVEQGSKVYSADTGEPGLTQELHLTDCDLKDAETMHALVKKLTESIENISKRLQVQEERVDGENIDCLDAFYTGLVKSHVSGKRQDNISAFQHKVKSLRQSPKVDVKKQRKRPFLRSKRSPCQLQIIEYVKQLSHQQNSNILEELPVRSNRCVAVKSTTTVHRNNMATTAQQDASNTDVFSNPDMTSSSNSVPDNQQEIQPNSLCQVTLEKFAVPKTSRKCVSAIQPSVCDLCYPTRIFLTNTSLEAHVSEEHPSSIERQTEPHNLTIHITESLSQCPGCLKPFHFSSKLQEHINSCRDLLDLHQALADCLRKVPQLRELSSSATVSISKGRAKSDNEIDYIKKETTQGGVKIITHIHKVLKEVALRSRKRNPTDVIEQLPMHEEGSSYVETTKETLETAPSVPVRSKHTNWKKLRPIQCKVADCMRKFRSYARLNRHFRAHIRKDDEKCDKQFSESSTLNNSDLSHMEPQIYQEPQHSDMNPVKHPFSCIVCPLAFNQRALLCEHILSSHSGSVFKAGYSTPVYECSVCGAVAGDSNDLVLHLIQHSDDSRLNSLTLSDGEAQDDVTRDNDDTDKDSDNDDEDLPQNENLKETNSSTPVKKPKIIFTNPKPYEVVTRPRSTTLSGRLYGSKNSLSENAVNKETCRDVNGENRRKTASSIYPSAARKSCGECGKHFQYHHQLLVHRLVHTRELPYWCRHCRKVFAEEGALKRHERIHTRSKKNADKGTLKSSKAVRKKTVQITQQQRGRQTENIKRTETNSKRHEAVRKPEREDDSLGEDMTEQGTVERVSRLNYLGRDKVADHNYCQSFSVAYVSDQVHKYHRYKCPFCSSAFTNFKSFNKHKSIHRKTMKNTLPSEKEEQRNSLIESLALDTRFLGRDALGQGQESETESGSEGVRDDLNNVSSGLQHEGAKPHVCVACPRSFNQRVLLLDHVLLHHTEDMVEDGISFCWVCGALTGDSYNLANHLVKHSDEKLHRNLLSDADEDYEDIEHLVSKEFIDKDVAPRKINQQEEMIITNSKTMEVVTKANIRALVEKLRGQKDNSENTTTSSCQSETLVKADGLTNAYSWGAVEDTVSRGETNASVDREGIFECDICKDICSSIGAFLFHLKSHV